MDLFSSRYYDINKWTLYFIGLWPYQGSFSKGFTLAVMIYGVINFVVPQAIYLCKHSSDVDNMFAVMPTLTGGVILTLKAGTIAFNSTRLKTVLDRLRDDWTNLISIDEIEILKKYAKNGRRITACYAYFAVIPTFGCILWPLKAPLLDIISPLNRSRDRSLIHPAEYAIDQDKYYYVLYASEVFAYIIGLMIGLGCDGMYIILIEHTCGMFAIVSHRLKNIWRKDSFGEINDVRRNEETCHRLTECIRLHLRTKEFTNMIVSIFTTYLLLDIGPGLLMHSVACVLIVIYIDHPANIGNFASLAFAQSCRLFLNSWPGQKLIDHSSRVWISAYESAWYELPNHAKKLLLILVMRSQIPCSIIIGKLYVVSLDNFGVIMKTSLSYCTLMASLHDAQANS